MMRHACFNLNTTQLRVDNVRQFNVTENMVSQSRIIESHLKKLNLRTCKRLDKSFFEVALQYGITLLRSVIRTSQSRRTAVWTLEPLGASR